MSGIDITKLQFQFVEPNRTIVDNVHVAHWNQIRLLHIKPQPHTDPEDVKMFGMDLGKAIADKTDGVLPVVVWGDHFDLNVYVMGTYHVEMPGQLELDFSGTN